MLKEKTQRIHGIDALRAIAMILGIFLHATIAYKVEPVQSWTYDNSFHHWGYDYLYMFIHTFRMPLFFLIGGYFCRFLFFRIGEKAFIKHRWKRIGLPFILSLIIILPFTIFPFLVFDNSNRFPGDWNRIFSESLSQLYPWNGMAHLWFLYYLLIYYVAVIVLARIGRTKPFSTLLTFLSGSSFFRPGSLMGIMILAVPVSLLLLMVPEIYFHVHTGIIPSAPYLLVYAVFFVTGWLINKSPGAFKWMSDNGWALAIAGVLSSLIVFWSYYSGYLKNGPEYRMILAKIFLSFQTILLVFGIIGIFLRYCKTENKLWKYISDASYWMYLIHLCLVVSMQVLLMQTTVPGVLRFPIVLVFTLFITIVTYHYWIRYTIIGEYLHGKRERTRVQHSSREITGRKPALSGGKNL